MQCVCHALTLSEVSLCCRGLVMRHTHTESWCCSILLALAYHGMRTRTPAAPSLISRAPATREDAPVECIYICVWREVCHASAYTLLPSSTWSASGHSQVHTGSMRERFRFIRHMFLCDLSTPAHTHICVCRPTAQMDIHVDGSAVQVNQYLSIYARHHGPRI